MSNRSRSPPRFAPRHFGLQLRAGTQTPTRAEPAVARSQAPAVQRHPTFVPAFVSLCPSLGQPAAGRPGSSSDPGLLMPPGQPLALGTGATSRQQACSALGAKTLEGRPRMPPANERSLWQPGARRPAGAAAAAVPHGRLDLDTALPGLRQGAPGRLASRPPLQRLDTPSDREQALLDLTDGFYAASSGSAVRARRSCYTRILALWNENPLPLTIQKVLYLAAGLKARRYRSAASVLSQLRVDAERTGEEISAGLRRAFTDSARSCRRGLGPSVTARALAFEKLGDLPLEMTPWATAGPVGPAAAMVVGSWWLLRETEAANLRASHVTFRNARGTLTAEVLLPVSKNDQEAKGVARAQACLCGGPARRPDCPAHSALRQMALLRRLFPDRFDAAGPHVDLPFFPQLTGKPVTKEGFTRTIFEAARRLNMEMTTADGAERFSGHSLRATGAQGLATLGVETYAIQLLGRWGSGVVLRYVRTAAITAAAAAARSAAASVSLSTLVDRAAGAGLTGENCSEHAIADLIELHAPGALARSRESLLAELRAELTSRGPRPSSTTSSSSSSASSSRSSSRSPPGAEQEIGACRPAAADAVEGGCEPTALVPRAAAGPPALADGLSPDRPGDGEGRITSPRYVSNEIHKRWHVIRIGPPVLDPTCWKTICGWRFGRSDSAGAVDPDHKPCDRCARGVGLGLH